MTVQSVLEAYEIQQRSHLSATSLKVSGARVRWKVPCISTYFHGQFLDFHTHYFFPSDASSSARQVEMNDPTIGPRASRRSAVSLGTNPSHRFLSRSMRSIGAVCPLFDDRSPARDPDRSPASSLANARLADFAMSSEFPVATVTAGYVLMRRKGKCFTRDPSHVFSLSSREHRDCEPGRLRRLTIGGLYYVSSCRETGTMEGLF